MPLPPIIKLEIKTKYGKNESLALASNLLNVNPVHMLEREFTWFLLLTAFVSVSTKGQKKITHKGVLLEAWKGLGLLGMRAARDLWVFPLVLLWFPWAEQNLLSVQSGDLTRAFQPTGWPGGTALPFDSRLWQTLPPPPWPSLSQNTVPMCLCRRLSKDLKPFHSLFLKHGTGGHQHKIYSVNADLWVLPQTYGDGIWMDPGNLHFKWLLRWFWHTPKFENHWKSFSECRYWKRTVQKEYLVKWRN